MSKKQKRSVFIVISRLLLVFSFFLIWEIAARTGRVDVFYTSYPTEIATDLVDFIVSGELIRHMSITLQEALTGLFYGTIIGVTSGVLLSQFSTLGKILQPIITAIYGIPQLAMAPIYILWFGTGIFAKIFLAGLCVFFNVFFSTYNAMKNIDQKLLESASLLGAGKYQMLWYVVIPTSMPWIISGIRMGAGVCMLGAIVGEYMGASGGFGWAVTEATNFFEVKRVMSCIIVLMIVGVTINYLLNRLENFVLRWRMETDLSMNNKAS